MTEGPPRSDPGLDEIERLAIAALLRDIPADRAVEAMLTAYERRVGGTCRFLPGASPASIADELEPGEIAVDARAATSGNRMGALRVPATVRAKTGRELDRFAILVATAWEARSGTPEPPGAHRLANLIQALSANLGFALSWFGDEAGESPLLATAQPSERREVLRALRFAEEKVDAIVTAMDTSVRRSRSD